MENGPLATDTPVGLYLRCLPDYLELSVAWSKHKEHRDL